MTLTRPTKTQHLMIPLLGVAAFAVPMTASADVLASWDVWGDATASYDADTELAGFEGTIASADAGRVNGTGFGSTDGTFGTIGTAATDQTALLVRNGIGANLIDELSVLNITITNNTGSSYTIDSIHFDIGVRTSSGEGFVLTYTSGGLGPVATEIANVSGLADTGNLVDQHDFDYNLGSFLTDITLDNGESAVFTLDITDYEADIASSVVDNVAIQGTLVPEPGSLALLGLGGLLIARRRRA